MLANGLPVHAFDAVAEQVVANFVVAQVVQSHQSALGVLGLGEDAHAVGKVGLDGGGGAVHGVKHAHVPLGMLGLQGGVEALGGVDVHHGQSGLAGLEALGVVLGVDHRVAAPEAAVAPILHLVQGGHEDVGVQRGHHVGFGVVLAHAVEEVGGREHGVAGVALGVGLHAPDEVEHELTVIVGAHVQGDHGRLVVHDGLHVLFGAVKGVQRLDAVFVHQVAAGHPDVGGELLIVHGQHVDLAVHLGLLPGFGIHALGGHGGVGLQRFGGDLPEALLGGLGVVEAPVGGEDDVPVLAGGEDQRVFLFILAPAHELHIDGGVDLFLQALVDLLEHQIVVHRAVADEVHGEGDFLGDVRAGGGAGTGRAGGGRRGAGSARAAAACEGGQHQRQGQNEGQQFR